jgi:HEAT repeat protein
VLEALGNGDGEIEPFLGRDRTGAARDKARAVVAALEPSIVPLARHPDPLIRARAITLVARSASDAAIDAVVAGLEDPDEAVQRVALASVGARATDGSAIRANPRAVAAAGRILSTHDSWAVRILAAEALGRLGVAGGGPEASRRLSDAASRDSYALVREKALESLAAFDSRGAHTLATTMAASDPEPRVRDAALAILRSSGSGRE